VNPDQAVTLVSALLRTTLYVTGPLLAASIIAGVFVGIVQTATQVNEASISFVVKVVAVVTLAAAVGSQLATYVLDYTRANLEAIGNVVR
jgi:flagellar biosynthetic protein FliQ